MRHVITLTTDFGLSDAYVGVMKGVILGLAPQATIVDICHDIPVHDVAAGCFLLAGAYHYFAEGAIHVAVVDPGVGGERRPVALALGGHTFVGPDNGLFSFLLSGELRTEMQAIHLTNRAYWLPAPGATFHGRDIFAPVAAHLAMGVALDALGEPLPVDDLVRLPPSEPERQGNVVLGKVVYVDRFGNLITNIAGSSLHQPQHVIVEVAGESAPLRRTYADAPAGHLVALIGSSGYLEIAINAGSAAQRLAVHRDAVVRVTDGI